MTKTIGGKSFTTVEKFVLQADTKQGQAELAKVARVIRQQQRAAKDLTLVEQEMARAKGEVINSERQFATAVKTSVAQMAGAHLAAIGMARGLATLRQGIRSVISDGLTWNDWIGDNSAALDGMANATDNIVGKLDLVRARTKLTTGDFQANESQLQALAKAAVVYSRVVKVDLRSALDKISDAAIMGRDKPLRQLGIDVELLGSKAEKTENFLRVLEQRFGGVDIKASNANEQISQMSAAWHNATGELGHAILSTDAISGAINRMVAEIQNATRALQAFKQEGFKGGAFEWAMGMMGQAGVGDSALRAIRAQKGGALQDIMPGFEGPQIPAGILAQRQGQEKLLSGRLGGGRRSGPRRHRGGGGRSFGRGGPELRDPAAVAAEMAAEAQRALAESVERSSKRAQDAELASLDARIQGYKAYRDEVFATDKAMRDMAIGGLAQIAGGMWAAADAALAGGESFGAAMQKMVKATLLGIAQQSTVQAIFQLAEGFGALASTWGVPNPKSIAAFTSAGKYAIAAAAAGAAGLAIPGGSRGGGAGAGTASSTRASAPRATPRDRRKQQNTIIVEVYEGDMRDKGAQLMRRYRTEARAA